MTTIRETLNQFLAETGEGNPGSMSSPHAVIMAFANCLDHDGHEALNEFRSQVRQ